MMWNKSNTDDWCKEKIKNHLDVGPKKMCNMEKWKPKILKITIYLTFEFVLVNSNIQRMVAIELKLKMMKFKLTNWWMYKIDRWKLTKTNIWILELGCEYQNNELRTFWRMIFYIHLRAMASMLALFECIIFQC